MLIGHVFGWYKERLLYLWAYSYGLVSTFCLMMIKEMTHRIPGCFKKNVGRVLVSPIFSSRVLRMGTCDESQLVMVEKWNPFLLSKSGIFNDHVEEIYHNNTAIYVSIVIKAYLQSYKFSWRPSSWHNSQFQAKKLILVLRLLKWVVSTRDS